MEKQKGNALFLILIAVALFAALSYAVTNSGRGGSGIDKEQVAIDASEIIQYAGLIEQAVMRLRLISGCADNEISYWHDHNEDGVEDSLDILYNVNAPTDHSCHVFHPNGGNLNYYFPGSAYIITFNGAAAVDGIGTTCTSAECSDLRMIVRLASTSAGVSTAAEIEHGRQLCIEINSRLGLPDLTTVLMGDDTPPPDDFRGTFVYYMTYGQGATAAISGLNSYCAKVTTSPEVYSFNHVIIAR